MTEHAHPQKEELKKHGDELENALKDTSGPSAEGKKNQPANSGKNKE
jgi:hypothetical protein